MKNLTSLLMLLIILSGFNSLAQTANEKFQTAIKKGLDMLTTSKVPDDFLKTANYFERVAQVETKEWIPHYYAAYNNLLAGLTSSDNTLKDQYWDKALSQVESAGSISAGNSEIFALKGYIQFMKMSIDPQSRMSLMGASSASLAKAKELNPENPRTYLIMGQDTFYTPEAFGGGKARAKPILETAVAKFAAFKPENAIEPNWGSGSAKDLLAKCN